MATASSPDKIAIEVLAAPSPVALRSVQPKSTDFAADLDFAESGYGELVRRIRTRATAFSGADTLVEGGSVADVGLLVENHGEKENCLSTSSRQTTSSGCTDTQCIKGCKGYHRMVTDDPECFPSGFPRAAAFLNHTNNFTMFRRFGRVHCRLLLHLQAEITVLEKKLDILDQQDEQTGKYYRLKRCSWDPSWNADQKELLEELKQKVTEYDELLTKDQTLRAFEHPPRHSYFHVFDWFFGTKALDFGHYEFVNHPDDMVYSSDVTRNVDGFDRYVEKYCSRWPSSPIWSCLHLQRRRKTPSKMNEDIFLFSKARILLLAKLIAVLISVISLLLPVFLLAVVPMERKVATTLVLIFVLAFALLLSLFVGANAKAVFLASCAYCAVLVTFLS
ncbi:hypothetical protein OIDMADRAFT_181832, partial [Oidiodendron maius Zn]